MTVRSHTNIDKPDQDVTINLSEPVSLTFSLKYLVNFCKASGLSTKVKLCLSQEVPLLVEYGLGSGWLRFYLAPKVSPSQQIPILLSLFKHSPTPFLRSGFIIISSPLAVPSLMKRQQIGDDE